MSDGEPECNFCAMVHFEKYYSVEVPCQSFYQLHTQGPGVCMHRIMAKADTIVRDDQLYLGVYLRELDGDRPPHAERECVFNGIGHGFVDNKTKGDGMGYIQF